MKTLFSSAQYDSAKSKDLLPCECKFCKKTFLAQKRTIDQEIKFKRGRVQFCSQKCLVDFTKKRVLTTCPTCGKEIEKTPREINQAKNGYVYCSRHCAAIMNNKLRPKKEKQLKTKSIPKAEEIKVKHCARCKIELTKENTYYRSKTYLCKKCYITYQHTRMKNKKIEVINAFGGKCFDCGGQYPPEVFDFHHLDPLIKKFNWRQMQKQTKDEMQEELAKCVLLCANCHRIRHIKNKVDISAHDKNPCSTTELSPDSSREEGSNLRPRKA